MTTKPNAKVEERHRELAVQIDRSNNPFAKISVRLVAFAQLIADYESEQLAARDVEIERLTEIQKSTRQSATDSMRNFRKANCEIAEQKARIAELETLLRRVGVYLKGLPPTLMGDVQDACEALRNKNACPPAE